MKTNIVKRLEQLELRYKADPLMIKAESENGEVVTIDARELENNPDLSFAEVVSGSDPKGLDAILNSFERKAYEECGV